MNVAQNTSNPGVRVYTRFANSASYLQSFSLLLLRIGIGFGLWFSAYGHLTHVDKMVAQFTDWGIPLPKLNVYISGLTEALGGILLIAGLGTRLISIPLIFNFVVAYATASKDEFRQFFGIIKGGSWSAWGDIVNDSAMPFLVAAFITLAFGAGKISIDYLLVRTVFRKTLPPDPVLVNLPRTPSTGRQL
jgi:putative oxidoreductase